MTIFSNLLHTFRNTLLALFFTLPLLSNTYAASAANIQVTHCTTDIDSCGKVLVGAARIDFNGIRWNAPETVGSLNLETVAEDFGFTGNSIYLTAPSSDGVWKFSSTKRIVISNPSSGVSMNHFFAPTQPGIQTASHIYYTLLPDDNKSVKVTGEGVADDPIIPAMTLNVTANSTQAQLACEVASCQVPVQLNKTVTFTVTPKLNPSLVSSQVRSVEYVLVNLRVEEHNTQCTRNNLSFRDKGLGKKNSRGQWGNIFTSDNYYHYLNGAGPDSTPQTCLRNYSFLTRVDDGSNPAVDKSFSFQTTNTRDTGTGYVDYIFYVNGHYDPNNPNLTQYPGSWKSLQLTTNAQVVTRSPEATFTVTPSSGQVPLTVNLDISGSSGSPAWKVTKNQQSTSLIPTLSTGNLYKLILSEVGFYDITLTTTTADGKQSTSFTQNVSVTASPVVEECGLPTYNPADVSAILPCVIMGNQPQQITLKYQGTTNQGYYWQVSLNGSTCKDNASATRCLVPESNGEVKISQAKMTDGQDLNLVVTGPIVFKPLNKEDGILYWEYVPTTASDIQANFAAVQNTLTDGTVTVDLTGALLTLPEGKTEQDYQYQWEITDSHHQTVILQPGEYTIKLNVTDAEGQIVDTVSQTVVVSPTANNTLTSKYSLFLEPGGYLAQVTLPKSSGDNPTTELEWSLSMAVTSQENFFNQVGFTASSLMPATIKGVLEQDETVSYESDLLPVVFNSTQTSLTNTGKVALSAGEYVITAGENNSTHPRWNLTLLRSNQIRQIEVNGWLNVADENGGYVVFGVDSSQQVEFEVSGAKPLNFKVLRYNQDTQKYDISIYPKQ